MIEMEDADGIGRKGDEQAVQPLPTKGLLLGSKNNQMPEAAASSHLRQLGCMAVWLTFRRSDSAVSTGHEMLPPQSRPIIANIELLHSAVDAGLVVVSPADFTSSNDDHAGC